MKTTTRKKTALAGGAVLLLATGFMVGRFSAPAGAGSSPVPEGFVPPASMIPISGSPKHEQELAKETTEIAAKPSWDRRWKDLLAQPPGGAREKAMAEALRELALTDPDQALGLAKQETNFRVRQDLLCAALGGWATVNPGGPMDWAVANLFDAERRGAIESIIKAGTAVKRDEMIQATNTLCEKDAGMADDYGRMLIAALAENSDFEAAMNFAATSTTEHRDYWLGAAMYSWSQYRPQEAAEALKKVSSPAAYNEAAHGLILGWGSNDPPSLVKFAEQLPPGRIRAEAYNQALQYWVTHDPVAASAWLDSRESAKELDSGMVKLATSPFLVDNNVETALSWATSVSDPEQRSIAFVDIIQQWSQRDPEAARRYAESLPDKDLRQDYRSELMKNLSGAPAVVTEAPR